VRCERGGHLEGARIGDTLANREAAGDVLSERDHMVISKVKSLKKVNICYGLSRLTQK